LGEIDGVSEDLRDELRRAREELGRLADVERELVFWRARAETAEALAAQWRVVKNRTLWKLFSAVDRMRDRIAPPGTRRERVVLTAARRAARAVAPRAPTRRGREDFERTGQKDVLLVYDERGASATYRCHHQAEQLEHVGLSADVVLRRDADLAASVDHYDTVILNRVAWDEQVGNFINAARRAGRNVIFDTDDLIFEPDLYREFAFLDKADEQRRQAWRERLECYRQTLAASDRAIVSTEPLAQHARRVVSHVDVVPNAVSSAFVRHADEALAQRSYAEEVATDREVAIGYLSGSPSHDRDFREASDAVLWALQTHSYARFVVVGFLDLDVRFAKLESRITRIPKIPFEALPSVVARIDINLAPVERTVFTECKSCVKYLEAGLVRVPTIASALPDFVRVIDNGRNGMLADSTGEWEDRLGRLIESAETRTTMGALAYDDVRANHTTSARAPLLRRVLEESSSASREHVAVVGPSLR
jgi:glycosyltransferase involved in cell wall biosynthesis